MKQRGLFILIMLFMLGNTTAQDDNLLPEFEVWVECIERGVYPGWAVADLSYRYSGEFPLAAEDSRYFGDTATGDTVVFSFRIEPGEHLRFAKVEVGALKAVMWKIVLFDKLYVVSIFDDPQIADCSWESVQPTPTPVPDV